MEKPVDRNRQIAPPSHPPPTHTHVKIPVLGASLQRQAIIPIRLYFVLIIQIEFLCLVFIFCLLIQYQVTMKEIYIFSLQWNALLLAFQLFLLEENYQFNTVLSINLT